jgi:hypothetical protein
MPKIAGTVNGFGEISGQAGEEDLAASAYDRVVGTCEQEVRSFLRFELGDAEDESDDTAASPAAAGREVSGVLGFGSSADG